MITSDVTKYTIGWVGMGRMGYPMAKRLAKAGCDLAIWNRTRSKAEPLTELGATLVDNLVDLGHRDIVFSMVSTSDDVKQIYFGENGVLSGDAKPQIVVDCSSISVEASAEIRLRLNEMGIKYIPGLLKFNSKVREFITNDPSWEEVRHADGKKIKRSNLVTRMTGNS